MIEKNLIKKRNLILHTEIVGGPKHACSIIKSMFYRDMQKMTIPGEKIRCIFDDNSKIIIVKSS